MSVAKKKGGADAAPPPVKIKLSTTDVVASYIYNRCKEVGLTCEDLKDIKFFDVGDARPCEVIRQYARCSMGQPLFSKVQRLLPQLYELTKTYRKSGTELKQKYDEFIKHFIFPRGSDPDWNKIMLLLYLAGEICEGMTYKLRENSTCQNNIVLIIQLTISFLVDSFVDTAFIQIKGGWENIYIVYKYFEEIQAPGSGEMPGKALAEPVAPWDVYDFAAKFQQGKELGLVFEE